MNRYPKRLIEVDLPIKRISAHARREKSVGHLSTLHVWWARRPLAACRAVICAALWPDPADELCPPAFREAAFKIMREFAQESVTNRTVRDELLSEYTLGRVMAINQGDAEFSSANPNANSVLQRFLLDFIADFANWDASTNPLFLQTARDLTLSAHEALGGTPGTSPLVVDPFAGGGSIPLEALRVGADVFASDLNPVAVLLNKVILEYIPKYGRQLADEVRTWGKWIKKQAEKELAEFYPKDPDGATPIAYLWARTVRCEGPGCGAEVPLIRSLWLAKKGTYPVALQIVGDNKDKRIEFEIIEKRSGKWVCQANPKSQISSPSFEGTVKRGSPTCPVCGYTTPVASVRKQLKERRGGAHDARLFAVVTTKRSEQGRFFRLPTERDLDAVRESAKELERRKHIHAGPLSLVPEELTPSNQGHRAVGSVSLYGMENWGDLFTPRQALVVTTLGRLIRNVGDKLGTEHDSGFATAVQTCLAMAMDRQADHTNSLCRWNPSGPKLQHLFGRQAIPMTWDFAEAQPFGNSVGDWLSAIDCVLSALENASHFLAAGQIEQMSAITHSLPDDVARAFVTDPPYYDAVPYADLADFFYVWLKRTIGHCHKDLLRADLTPNKEQAIVWHLGALNEKKEFERKMSMAMAEGRRVLAPDGIGIVVFAHKSTAGWEAQLQAMIDAGWTMTGSWPIDTEMGTRLNAMNTASLASSIHLVCRPRENPDGSLAESVGDWRDVLSELPTRIHEWMPRLAQEGVVGADAIFSCLGPALEIFSRYSQVERNDGTRVPLGDVKDGKGNIVERGYLSYVWEAIAREALNMIFQGADASGFEEDARLTAMWLWTLRTAANGNGKQESAEEDEDEDAETKPKKTVGYALEYDAARKIAQGLGAYLEKLGHLVEVKGDTATLLPAGARTKYLFGKEATEAPKPKRKKEGRQLSLDLGKELEEVEEESGIWPGDLHATAGKTILDQLHQSMILFGAGRGEALKRFLVDDGIGRNPMFWRLAQALSALYPPTSDEKRWVDGVLARKKGLGL